MNPGTNWPPCPHCGLGPTVPRARADWNHRAKPGDRIVCSACGDGWVGTIAEVTQATAAQLEWDAVERGEIPEVRR